MDIFTLAGTPNELKLMLMEMIQRVLVVNLAFITAVTVVVCLTNLLLCARRPRR